MKANKIELLLQLTCENQFFTLPALVLILEIVRLNLGTADPTACALNMEQRKLWRETYLLYLLNRYARWLPEPIYKQIAKRLGRDTRREKEN